MTQLEEDPGKGQAVGRSLAQWHPATSEACLPAIAEQLLQILHQARSLVKRLTIVSAL